MFYHDPKSRRADFLSENNNSTERLYKEGLKHLSKRQYGEAVYYLSLASEAGSVEAEELLQTFIELSHS